MRDTGSIPASGRSPGGRHGNPLQYSCLENPVDREAWQAAVHRVAKNWIRLKQLRMHARTHVKGCFNGALGRAKAGTWDRNPSSGPSLNVQTLAWQGCHIVNAWTATPNSYFLLMAGMGWGVLLLFPLYRWGKQRDRELKRVAVSASSEQAEVGLELGQPGPGVEVSPLIVHGHLRGTVFPSLIQSWPLPCMVHTFLDV